MRLVQLKKSLRQMILFSQTGQKPWLPISYIMRNMERERERCQILLGLEISLEYDNESN